MGKTGTVKHTHQYYRRHNGIWHCSGYEECTHYVPKNMPEPTGRKSLCWNCQQPFQLTPVNMEKDKPMCDACSERMEILDDYIERKLAESRLASKRAPISTPTVTPAKTPALIVEDEIETYDPDGSD